MTIHVANIKLTNSDNKIIAEYPSYRIVFCNSFSDQDKQYFGILTKSSKDTDDIVSNSCHVFTIYYKLIDHNVHSSTCNKFGFTCTKTSELNVCQEFPDSCNGLIGAIQTLYITSDTTDTETQNQFINGNNNNCDGRKNNNRDTVSPQPSNISTSTAHSSNSDSGIGFKDDYGSQSDFLQRRNNQHININNPRSSSVPCSSRLDIHTRQNFSSTRSSLSRELYSLGNRETIRASCSNIRKTVSIVAAMEEKTNRRDDVENNIRRDDGGGGDTTTTTSINSCLKTSVVCKNINSRQQDNSSSVGSSTFSRTIAKMLRPIDNDDNIIRDLIHNHDNNNDDNINMCNKLSPKVFNSSSKSFVHSMENLKQNSTSVNMDTFLNISEVRPWGSLQEIRNVSAFESDCMVSKFKKIIFFFIL